MYCGQCGNEVKPEARFCGHCGAETVRTQPAQAASVRAAAPPSAQTQAPPRPMASTAASSKLWVWGGAAALAVALLGGSGYWAWTNKHANDEAARKLAQVSEVNQRRATEAAAADTRRVSAENVAERAEIAAAQAALSKRIADEEALAKARAGMK